MHVRLLGRPSIVDDDGTPMDVRGQKPWALLGRLVLAERPPTRRELSAELFPETVDPLGSLRWTLASLRKALGIADLFTGDPVSRELPLGVTVDVVSLANGMLDPDALGELLEGINPPSGPEFEIWLLVARQKIAARVDAVLHDHVVSALSRGDHQVALRLADIAARRAPYDEGAQILLVKSLVASGATDAAVALVADVEARFERELGVTASAALRSAARRGVAFTPPGVSAHSQATALLEAGRAALAAGAVDAGLDCLRRAAAEAEGAGDDVLLAWSVFELGTALVHSSRGFDDEGSVLLERAVLLAEQHGERELFVNSMRERGYVDALAGRRTEAERRLALAASAAEGNATLLAGVEGINGLNYADWGRPAEGLEHFDRSIDFARSAGNREREAWALGIGAWAALSDGRTHEASQWSSSSLAIVRDLRWVSFEPWPIAVTEEIRLVVGDGAQFLTLEKCFAQACQLADPCWQGAAARLIALHHSAAGRHDDAVRWITDAARRARSANDTWAAVIGAIHLSEADIWAAAGDTAGAQRAARESIAFSAHAQLDGMLARAVTLLSH
jgi:DNA-binding SARP family transcriptional activator